MNIIKVDDDKAYAWQLTDRSMEYMEHTIMNFISNFGKKYSHCKWNSEMKYASRKKKQQVIAALQNSLIA